MPKGPTPILVAGLMGLGFSVAVWNLVGWRWGLFCLSLLLYEGWTFLNRFSSDTISETIWALSRRPLVPFAFGLGVCWALTSGLIPTTGEGLWVAFFLGGLAGHFFFQAQGVYDSDGET